MRDRERIEAESDRLAGMIGELLKQAKTELRGGHGGRAIELLQQAKNIADQLPKGPSCQPTTKTDKTE